MRTLLLGTGKKLKDLPEMIGNIELEPIYEFVMGGLVAACIGFAMVLMIPIAYVYITWMRSKWKKYKARRRNT